MFISPEIVFGFHGCDQEIADKVIKNGESLSFSENSYKFVCRKPHVQALWMNSNELKVTINFDK